ncbi:MAG TPA: hypothetical protein VF727_15575 [Allosphingosinicella sp.]
MQVLNRSYRTAAVAAEEPALRLLRRLSTIAAAVICAFCALSYYESRHLGLFPLGEVAPVFDAYHLARSAAALSVSLLIAWTIYGARAADGALMRRDIPAAGSAAALAVLALALGFTSILLLEPRAFAAGAREDSAVEWASALLVLAGSGLFLFAWRNAAGPRLATILPLAFAFVFFLVGMEEISWLQRVIGFETPAEIAQANMQREFNLHNVHTDLAENLYYVGGAGFLIVLPFLRDALPARALPAWLDAYVPGRWVAAASAPLSIFNYGMWNVIPMQVTMMLTVVIAAFYGRAALLRGSRAEAALFGAMAFAVTAGQAVFLARAQVLPNLWDPSEYKELFIAIGLAAYAADVALRSRRRGAAPV